MSRAMRRKTKRVVAALGCLMDISALKHICSYIAKLLHINVQTGSVSEYSANIFNCTPKPALGSDH